MKIDSKRFKIMLAKQIVGVIIKTLVRPEYWAIKDVLCSANLSGEVFVAVVENYESPADEEKLISSLSEILAKYVPMRDEVQKVQFVLTAVAKVLESMRKPTATCPACSRLCLEHNHSSRLYSPERLAIQRREFYCPDCGGSFDATA